MKNLTFLFSIIVFVSCSKDNDNTPATIVDNPSQQKTIDITVDGYARSFVVYNPLGYNNAGKMPMVFVNHGGQGDAVGMIQLADFRTIADREKVVLVYPTGYEKSWNDGRPTAANLKGIDDVNFFRKMCDYMVANYGVNNSKIYVTGISNGGFMSSRLGCELSDRIAAIAVDAASIEEGIANSCNPKNPVPAMYIQGTLDPLVPFNGGVVTPGAGGTAISHTQAITKWITLNNCSTTPIVTNLPDSANDGTTIKQRVYTNTTNGTEVVSYVVLNGGHTWPQGYAYLPESIIGITSQDMNACEVIWKFFKKYSR
jgi:polyhydroxybutyrate depolymerase